VQQELLFRVELIRILLQHPYARLPEGYSRSAISMGSDMVISSYYDDMRNLVVNPEEYLLPTKKSYEWYVRRIMEMQMNDRGDEECDKGGMDGMGVPEADSNQVANPLDDTLRESLDDRSALWEEDPWKQEEIAEIVRQIQSWGSLPGSLVEQIIANSVQKLDYRKVISGFRASTISSTRRLTRMRPNRRTDFENMGSLYELKTRYLCAVDTSGSISHYDLNRFFSTINRFFKYGIDKIDVITCDARIQNVMELKKARSQIVVNGRGGTIFQPVIDYMEEHPEYDGLIFFTDGDGPVPVLHKKNSAHRILWLLRNEMDYRNHNEWMKTVGRVCYFG
jgi:predicted metal-dependent peptidase